MNQTAVLSTPRTRKVLATHLLLDLGLVFGTIAAILSFYFLVRGGLAYDMRAYWLAAQHVLNNQPLYVKADYSTAAIYTYPPIFAQIFAPAALIPESVMDWLWRFGEVLCLRYIVGSWKATIVACLFIPVLTELSIDNVTFQIAAALRFALRDRRGAYLLPWVAALKFGPVLLAPYLWFRMPASRRPLLFGTVIFGLACLISYLLTPASWADYLTMLGWQSTAPLNGPEVLHLIPGPGSLDFIGRFLLAAFAVLFAIRTRRPWLAYAATVVTCPVLAINRLAPLVGIWGLRPSTQTELKLKTATRPVEPIKAENIL